MGLWATQSSSTSQLYSSQDLNKLCENSYGSINDHNYLKQKRNSEGLPIPDFELYYRNLLIILLDLHKTVMKANGTEKLT